MLCIAMLLCDCVVLCLSVIIASIVERQCDASWARPGSLLIGGGIATALSETQTLLLLLCLFVLQYMFPLYIAFLKATLLPMRIRDMMACSTVGTAQCHSL